VLRHGLQQALLVAILLLSLVPNVQGAAPADEARASSGAAGNDRDGDDKPVGVDKNVDMERPVFVDHRFFFRFRAELLAGGDLGPGSSSVPQPLAATPINGSQDAATLAWASIRFRYEPVFHLGANLEIHVGIDALRNLVLGSTHVNAGGDFNQGLWNDAQGSPSAGINGFEDAIEIRHLYGRWRVFDLIDVYGGRMVDHFGLGILRNDGRGDDADFGSLIDRVMVGVSFDAIRIEASLEFTNIGATTANPYDTYGQPKDLGQDDDVTTYTVRVFSRPLTDAQKENRRGLLDVRRNVAFDWGALLIFTDQTYDSLAYPQTFEAPSGCEALTTTRSGLPLWTTQGSADGSSGVPRIINSNCYRLVPRDAFFFKPSLWAKWEWRPDFATRLRVEWEFAMVIGGVDNLQNEPIEGFEDTSKDWLSVGSALEVEVWWDSLRVGLMFGIATGDERRFLGYSDGQNITTPDDGNYETDENVNTNAVIESHWFNRDYRLDLILFRQVIGGVTNAIYVKPWVGYDIGLGEDVTISTKLDFLYAAAVDPNGTPGQGRHYGVEVDATVGLVYDNFTAALQAGVLVPMDALGDRETGGEPGTAYTIIGRFNWRYD